MPRVAVARLDPLFSYIRCLAEGRPLFTASYYSVDGVSGKVASFIDWSDTGHVLSQTVSANQVPVPVASALFNNAIVATFAATMFYTSNRPVRDWVYLHSGSGMDEFLCFRATGIAGGASVLAGTQTGTTNYQSLLLTTTGATASMNVNNASGSAIGVGDQAIAALGTPTWIRATVLAGTLTTKFFHKSTLKFSGTLSSPSIANPPSTFVLGKLPGGANAFIGDWHSFMLSPPLDTRAGNVATWIQQVTGITP
jgi:hypothetical protein